MKHRPAVTTFALLLGGCAVPIEPSPRDGGLTLPARFVSDATAAAAIAADHELWWRDLGDARLAEAVDTALRHNRDLHAAAARLDGARARAELAGASLSPALSARLSAQRNRFAFVGLPFGGGSVFTNTTNQYNLGLDLSWEADLWGRLRAGDLAANADVAAADADLRGAAHSIAARTAKAWIACVEAAQQLRLAEETARSRRATEQLIETRFERGVRGALDLHLARAERESAEAAIAARRRARDATVRSLQVLTGAYPDLAIDPGTALPPSPSQVPPGLPSELLQRRPDLVAAERRLAAADARVGEARADRWPRISLTASGGTTSDDLADLVDLDFRVWSLGANLLAPIFDGGRRTATIELRDAERRENESRFAALVLVALSEVEGGLANEVTLADEERRLDAAVTQARAAEAIASDRYSRGLADVTTLLDAQRRALAADTTLLAVRRARLDNHVDLLLALGGGLPVATADTDP